MRPRSRTPSIKRSLKLDPHRLTIFHAVVQTGSMSKAALELRFSPAAVSQHVAALERQVGAPLLVRHARGVRPTPAGELVARHARAIVGSLERAAQELDGLLSAGSGVVRLGIFTSATIGLLPHALERFARVRPDAVVALEEIDADVSADRLRSRDLDVAVVLDDPCAPELDRRGLVLTELGSDPMDVVLPADHRLAGAREVPLAALEGERWILPHGNACAAIVRRACHVAGFEPEVATTSDDYAAVRRLTATSVGVATVPRLAGHVDGDGVVVAALTPAPARTLYVARADGRAVTDAVAALRDAFVQQGR